MRNDNFDFGPEDLLRIARDVRDKLPGGLRTLGRVVGAVFVIVTLVGSYYQIEPDEVGLVMRFGRFVRTANPGPHTKIPYGIEQVRKVPVQRQLKQEFGFRTVRADIQT